MYERGSKKREQEVKINLFPNHSKFEIKNLNDTN